MSLLARRRMMMNMEDEDVAKEWRLIKTVEITEDNQNTLNIDKDDDGNEFEVNELLIYIENGDAALQAWHYAYKKNANGDISQDQGIIMQWYGTIAANKQMIIRITPDYPIGYDMEYGGQDVQNGHGVYQFTEAYTPITALSFWNQSAPAIGTKLTIYGR